MWKKVAIALIGVIGLVLLTMCVIKIANVNAPEDGESHAMLQAAEITVSLDAINRGTILQERFAVIEGDTVFSVMRSFLDVYQIPFEYNESPTLGVYVTSIAGIDAGDYGAMSGWMVRVNGEFIGESIANFALQGGEKVEILYTTDGGADLGATWE